MTVDIIAQASNVFKAFNILGMGISIIWIVGSFFLGRIISETKEEWMLTTLMLLASGMILIFADSPEKIMFLVLIIVLVLFGMFKKIWGRKEQ